MSRKELEAAGLNRSDVHVDFMIGSNQIVDGIRGWNPCATLPHGIGQFKGEIYLEICLSAFVGLLTGAITNRGRQTRVCFGKMFWAGLVLFRTVLFGAWGPT